jgi:hypothetical protein
MKSQSDADASYQLVVRGELDERYGYLFEGMQMARLEGTTIIAGGVRDQAQLHGLIERIEELGLELLSVQQQTVKHAPTPNETARRENSDQEELET